MKPIINPWIVYFAEVSDVIKCLNILLFIVAAIYFVITYDFSDVMEMSLDGFLHANEEKTEKNKKRWFSKIKKTCLCLFILLFFGLFVPSKETIYKMIIASYVTEDNYKKSKEEIYEIIDHVADKIVYIQKND